MSPKIHHAFIMSMFLNIGFSRQRSNREGKITKILFIYGMKKRVKIPKEEKGLRIKSRPLPGSGNVLQPKNKGVVIDILRNQKYVDQQIPMFDKKDFLNYMHLHSHPRFPHTLCKLDNNWLLMEDWEEGVGTKSEFS